MPDLRSEFRNLLFLGDRNWIELILLVVSKDKLVEPSKNNFYNCTPIQVHWEPSIMKCLKFLSLTKGCRYYMALRQACSLDIQRAQFPSKIQWFTEFCNSHYLSQLATFFIHARAKRSTIKSCIVFTFISCVIRSTLNNQTWKSAELLENSKKYV